MATTSPLIRGPVTIRRAGCEGTRWAIAIAFASVACAGPRGPIPAQRDVLTNGVRPELARIVRDGDPIGALAVAGLPPDAARPFLSSFEVVKNLALLLDKAGFRASADAGPDGWRLFVELDEASARDSSAHMFGILRSLGESGTADILALPSSTTIERPDAIARCAGRPSTNAAERSWLEHPAPAALRSWFAEARSTSRVSLAVVGNARVVGAVTESWAREPAWRTGEVVEASALSQGVTQIGNETVLAIPVQTAGGQVARSLAGDATILKAAGATLLGVSAHSVVGGHCVIVRFSAPASETDRIARYVSSEVTFRAAHVSAEDALLAAKRETDPRKAAIVSAWRRLVERTIRSHAAAASNRSVTVRSDSEIGQHELQLVVSSECPLMNEPRKEWGVAAATTHAASLGVSREGGVSVEPWISGGLAGIYVRGAALPGEGGALLASRLTSLATQSLWGAPPTRIDVERSLRWVQEQASSQRSLLLGALAENASSSQPSAVSPFGREGLGASYSDVVATHRSFRSMHFSIAVLSNDGAEQIEAATGAMARAEALFDVRAKGCTAPKLDGFEGGAIRISSSAGKEVNWLAYPIETPKRDASRVLAQAVTDGGLASALYETRAGAWLIIEVDGSSKNALHEIEHLRTLLVQIGQGHGDIAAARRALRLKETDPRERLVHLLDDRQDATDAQVSALANGIAIAKPLTLTSRAERVP